VQVEKGIFTVACSCSPKTNFQLVVLRHCFAEVSKEMWQNIYIPNSIKVALAIGHWAFGHTGHNEMLCLGERQTIASQRAIAQYPKQPLLN